MSTTQTASTTGDFVRVRAKCHAHGHIMVHSWPRKTTPKIGGYVPKICRCHCGSYYAEIIEILGRESIADVCDRIRAEQAKHNAWLAETEAWWAQHNAKEAEVTI